MAEVTREQRCEELYRLISDGLSGLVRSDYVLLDVPYYDNPGDVMIWEGTRRLLSALPYRCLGEYSLETWPEGKNLPEEVTILLQGGGNFGDLWRRHSDFRLRIIRDYPLNPIVILPQSVHYSDRALMLHDAIEMALHQSLTICARDNQSFALLSGSFKNRIMLLPDMAFGMYDDRRHSKSDKYSGLKGPSETILYIKRGDKERASTTTCSDESVFSGASGQHIYTADWCGKVRRFPAGLLLRALLTPTRIIPQKGLGKAVCYPVNRLADLVGRTLFRKRSIKYAEGFISGYDSIISTRLHPGVFALMRGVDCTFQDNSYGKIGALYDTWLCGTEGVRMAENCDDGISVSPKIKSRG